MPRTLSHRSITNPAPTMLRMLSHRSTTTGAAPSASPVHEGGLCIQLPRFQSKDAYACEAIGPSALAFHPAHTMLRMLSHRSTTTMAAPSATQSTKVDFALSCLDLNRTTPTPARPSAHRRSLSTQPTLCFGGFRTEAQPPWLRHPLPSPRRWTLLQVASISIEGRLRLRGYRPIGTRFPPSPRRWTLL